MPEKGQKNLLLAAETIEQLDALVASINRGLDGRHRCGPSEVVQLALDELLKGGEQRIRKILADRRHEKMVSPAGSTKSALEQTAGEIPEVLGDAEKKEKQKSQRKAAGSVKRSG